MTRRVVYLSAAAFIAIACTSLALAQGRGAGAQGAAPLVAKAGVSVAANNATYRPTASRMGQF